ncbi:AAA family ATPase [Candidatus Woesearchaeota archaeon]|nr:AAA family ATPase [Candidatus Woesearchaeota archaeon]
MIERIKSGVPGLDRLLDGGIPKGKVIMVSGPSGSGKTILAAQFVNEGIKNNENCVFITLEAGKQKLIEDLQQIGIDFSQLERKNKLRIIGGPVGHVKYFKEKTKATIYDIADEVKEVVLEVSAKRVVLDSINLFTMLFENDLERRKALADLVAVLSSLNCTTLLTCEVKEGSPRSISWHGFEEFVVDGVIVLYRLPFGNKYERAISVVKMRGVNHSQKVVSMAITKRGIEVYYDREPYHDIIKNNHNGG